MKNKTGIVQGGEDGFGGPEKDVEVLRKELLRAELIKACLTYLHSCEFLGKNYDSDYYSSVTEESYALWKYAEQTGTVRCAGNRSWFLSDDVKDELNAVFLKHATNIVDEILRGND